jgi:hypothetical protein
MLTLRSLIAKPPLHQDGPRIQMFRHDGSFTETANTFLAWQQLRRLGPQRWEDLQH